MTHFARRKEQYAADTPGAGTALDTTAIHEESNRAETLPLHIAGGTAFRPGKYQEPCPHEGAAFVVY